MLKVTIIENELTSLNLLKKILQEYCDDLCFTCSAGTINDAVHCIETNSPDLVFFDIELDDGQSFEIFDKLDHKDFKVIFTTAYDQYAIKAFQYDALDYILKPYTPSQVVKAVDKARKSKQKDTIFHELSSLLKNSNTNKRTITLATSEGLEIIQIDDIIRCQASQTYCNIFLLDDIRILISKSLSEIEKMLSFSDQFIRTHASHLVNLLHVKRVSTLDGDCIYMVNDDSVPLARRRKKDFIAALKRND